MSSSSSVLWHHSAPEYMIEDDRLRQLLMGLRGSFRIIYIVGLAGVISTQSRFQSFIIFIILFDTTFLERERNEEERGN